MPEGSTPEGTILGFDFGLRRIGVATGQTTTGTASPLTVVRHFDEPDWPAISGLVGEWRPAALVVGLPLGEDGSDSPMSIRVRTFGEELHARFGLEVFYFDERYSSAEAASAFADARAAGRARRRDVANLDAQAARIILQNWLQSRSG